MNEPMFETCRDGKAGRRFRTAFPAAGDGGVADESEPVATARGAGWRRLAAQLGAVGRRPARSSS